MTKTDQFFQKRWRDVEPEVLDENMTAGDIADILKRLKFEDWFRLIGVDRCVRDFLVSAVSATHRK